MKFDIWVFFENVSRKVKFVWSPIIRPETLEVEPEEEVVTDEKGPYILQSEVEKAIKEMMNRKATGDDDVPGDVLKVMGEVGLKTLKKINQNHIWNWRVTQGLHRSYNVCLKEKDTSYKM